MVKYSIIIEFDFNDVNSRLPVTVKMMNIKASEKGRHQKKKLVATRKGFQDNCAENEGTVYGEGFFFMCFSCLFNFTGVFYVFDVL